MKIKKNKGFTLIEMLLVITLIAIIAALSILTFRLHAESERIDKAALEMEQVLQAAMAYNNINRKWPENNSALPDCDPSNHPNLADFINHYLPNGEVTNDFGHHYCWGSTGGANQNNTLFWVAIQVPNHDIAMAKRIAARLPNAITTSNPISLMMPAPPCFTGSGECYVRAEVPESGENSNDEGTMVVAMGRCKTGQTITDLGKCEDVSAPGQQNYKVNFNSCPQGLIPEIMVNPNYLKVPETELNNPMYSLNTFVNNCTDNPDANNQETCVFTVEADFCWTPQCKPKNVKAFPGGEAGANYLVACIKPKSDFHKSDWL